MLKSPNEMSLWYQFTKSLIKFQKVAFGDECVM